MTGAARRLLPMLALLAALLAPAGLAAKTTGVDDDAAVQSGPCYDALVDKNAANPTTAPNRELGAACVAEHDDVDKAWARVIRLWGSDGTDLPDYSTYRPADAPLDGAMPRWLAFAGLLLTYAALGTPMRAAARLMGASPGPASGAAAEAVVCLMLRGAIIAILAALFGLPDLAAACGLALFVVLLTDRRAKPAAGASPPAEAGVGAPAVLLAALINDGLGAAAGLAALAFFAQHSVVLWGAALILALVASAGPVLAARRALRASRLGAAAARALLAAAIGEALILTPPVSGWLGGAAGASLAIPLLLAAATMAASLRDMMPSATPAR